ncbi:MAG: selenide, water dikinase SelD [Pirellulales bacterium]|nr:selenide, water dikinase SelD [Pirellulales bacterium]
MQARLPQREIVLLGAGHTHTHVLRRWRMSPLADARLTCISRFPTATYSGMLPGTLAGLYEPEAMEIDLVRLCASVGARLLCAEVTGLDVAGQRLQLANRPDVPFDVLSIGIGSVPRAEGLFDEPPAAVVPIKPMQTFLPRLHARLNDVALPGQTVKIVVVGAGVAGAEIAMGMPAYLRRHFAGRESTLTVIDRHAAPVRDLSPGAAARLARRLQRSGAQIILGRQVVAIDPDALRLDDGTRVPADVVLWATSAAAPPLLKCLSLPTDERGFLLTRPTLQTVAEAPIFAVGDCGTLAAGPAPKAGVYAVRQGPVLWENLGRLSGGLPLAAYRPQRGFLKLVSTGDGEAILDYRGWSAEGRWCWRLKDRIDRRFMSMHQDYQSPSMQDEALVARGAQPRCTGCGGKVAGRVLARTLARLEVPVRPDVLVGLDRPDDAAVLQVEPGPLLVTADFFAAFVDDPYLVGRVAAQHAASDVFASGGQPLAALALATIPPGPEARQEQLLYELLAGGLAELRGMGATLVGGHTIEGPQTTLGFTVLARAASHPRLKGHLRAGDRLVLTKPLGTGVLLAAHMQARCRAAWYAALVEMLVASNQPPSGIFERCDVAGMTDVTGFGLAGHLLEMLRSSRLAAEIYLDEVPVLPGAEELSAAGVASTLLPANRAVEAEMQVSPDRLALPRYALLFDPQTSGGLLLGVPETRVDEVVRAFTAQTGMRAAEIGRVVSRAGDAPSSTPLLTVQ